jgi:acyl carrier protein
MNENEILSKFSEIVLNVLDQPFEVLGLSVNLRENLGADSMDLVDILEAAELAFGIDTREGDYGKMANVGQAVTLIKELIDARQAG